jgi:hypothetical protein
MNTSTTFPPRSKLVDLGHHVRCEKEGISTVGEILLRAQEKLPSFRIPCQLQALVRVISQSQRIIGYTSMTLAKF